MIDACETCDQLRRALERVEAENARLRVALSEIKDAAMRGARVPACYHVRDIADDALAPPPQPEPVAKERVRCEVRDRHGEQCGLDKGHRGHHYLLIESDAPWFPTLPCTNPRRGSEGE